MVSYHLSEAAEADWREIALYTLSNFGEIELQRYTEGLLKCLDNLVERVGRFRSIKIAPHKVLAKPCQQHVIFALERTDERLLILAILHERMDLIRQLKHRLI